MGFVNYAIQRGLLTMALRSSILTLVSVAVHLIKDSSQGRLSSSSVSHCNEAFCLTLFLIHLEGVGFSSGTGIPELFSFLFSFRGQET